MQRETIISTPDTGHGNPATYWALLSTVPNLIPLFLKESGWLAQQAHSVMSTSSSVTTNYTSNSESTRTSFPAKVFAKLMFKEFMILLKQEEDLENHLKTWLVVQEHALLGANVLRLMANGIDQVNLVVPDVYPKVSGEGAIQRVGERGIETLFTVWNQEAYDDLTSLGFEARLVAPFLLDGFIKSSEIGREGTNPQVVVKSSGSGMTEEWVGKLQMALDNADIGYEIHLPDGFYDNQTYIKAGSDKRAIIQRFYNSLGDQTQIIISPPSEIVQVTADLRSRGESNVILLSLPPRGQHELKNLQWAVDAGLCPGVLNIFEGQEPSGDIPLIELSNIEYHINRVPDPVNLNLGTRSIRSVLG